MPDFSIVQSLPLPEAPAATSYAGSRLLKGQTDILGLLDSKADQYGVPRNLVRTVATMESSLNPSASSGKAFGLMQLEPTTAKTLGVQNVWDPEQNADGGTRLLRDLMNKYAGDTRLVLAAYNAGEPAVDKAGGVPNYPETQKYVVKGMRSLPANLLMGPTPIAAPDPNAPPVATPGETPSPGPAIQPTAAQAANGIDAILARIQRGEQVDVTPEDILRVAFGPTGVQTAAAPPPAAEPPAAPAFSVVKSLPLPPPPPPPSITDQLKNEGFLDSLWHTVISPLTITKSFVTGEYNAETQRQIQRYNELKQSGTPEQKREFARDVLLTNIPFASTLYKLVTGNWPGAAGDVTGVAALGGLAKAPEVAEAVKTGVGRVVDVATSPVVKDVIGVVSPRTKNILNLATRVSKAAETLRGTTPETPAPTAAPTAEAMTPGQAYAASQGIDWNTSRPVDRQAMEQIGQARINVANQPPPAPAAPPAARAPAPSVEPLKPGDVVQWQSQGVDQFAQPRAIRGFSPDGKWAFVEGTNTGIPVEQLTRAAAPPITPQELTNLETGRPPSRQSAAAQQTAAETLATAQAAAPPAAPVVPEAPAAAPTAPPVDPVAWTREQLAAGNKVSTGTLQRQFGMKYSAARKLLKDLSPPATSAEGAAAFEQAKATGQPVVTPTPEEEPILRPGETPAQALARMMPESAIPPSAPEPVIPTAPQSRIEAFAQHFASDPEITPDAVRAIEGNPEAARWLEKLGEALGIKGKPAPGEIRKIADRVRELRRQHTGSR